MNHQKLQSGHYQNAKREALESNGKVLSTITAFSDPRLKASIPIAPEPEKRSKKTAPAILL